LILFADDTKLLITEEDESALQRKIKNVMKELETWFQRNNFMTNTEKTTAVL
jgi:hypothetical protein